jgi:hypothetical protein
MIKIYIDYTLSLYIIAEPLKPWDVIVATVIKIYDDDLQ